MLLILAIVQFALFEHASHIAEAAAEQGLAAGRVTNGTAAAGNAAASGLLGQIGNAVLDDATVTTDREVATTTVTVSGDAEAVLPGFTLPVKVVASGVTERFVDDAGGAGP